MRVLVGPTRESPSFPTMQIGETSGIMTWAPGPARLEDEAVEEVRKGDGDHGLHNHHGGQQHGARADGHMDPHADAREERLEDVRPEDGRHLRRRGLHIRFRTKGELG